MTHQQDDGSSSIPRRIERFWFTPADPATLGFIRILTGLIVLYVHFCHSFDLLGYVSIRHGWVNDVAMQFMLEEYPIQVPGRDWTSPAEVVTRGQIYWSVFYHVDDPATIWAIHLGIFAILVLFTLGLWTPVMGVLTWMSYLQYVHRFPPMQFGMDVMIGIGLLYLMISPCGTAFSLDRWLERRRERRRTGNPQLELPVEKFVSANFAYRLFQIHFAIIYLAAGLSKLLGSAWWNGNATWLTLANPGFSPMNFAPYYHFLVFLTEHRWLFELVTYAGVVFTLGMEIGLPFLIWLRRWRKILIVGVVLLHVSIGLFMGLRVFSLMMMVLALGYVPPEAVRRLVGRLE